MSWRGISLQLSWVKRTRRTFLEIKKKTYKCNPSLLKACLYLNFIYSSEDKIKVIVDAIYINVTKPYMNTCKEVDLHHGQECNIEDTENANAFLMFPILYKSKRFYDKCNKSCIPNFLENSNYHIFF